MSGKDLINRLFWTITTTCNSNQYVNHTKSISGYNNKYILGSNFD